MYASKNTLASDPSAAMGPLHMAVLGHRSPVKFPRQVQVCGGAWFLAGEGLGEAGASLSRLQFAPAASKWPTLLGESLFLSLRASSLFLCLSFSPPFIPAVRQLINCTGRPSVHNIVMR